MSALETSLKARATSGTITDYVVKNGADKDLDASIKQLQEAITPDTPPAIKAALQAQLGSIQLNLAEYRMGVLQADLIDLNEQAAQVQALAQSAAGLHAQAGVLEKATRRRRPPRRTSPRGGHGKAEGPGRRPGEGQGPQGPGDAEGSGGAQIYADTDAAFTAADAQKGKAAIAAGNKAMTDRNQAEALMAEPAIWRASGPRPGRPGRGAGGAERRPANGPTDPGRV